MFDLFDQLYKKMLSTFNIQYKFIKYLNLKRRQIFKSGFKNLKDKVYVHKNKNLKKMLIIIIKNLNEMAFLKYEYCLKL